MLKLLSVSVLAMSLLFAGCASVPMAPKEQDQKLKEFTQPSADMSGIYIYRNSFVGQALKKNVYIDDTLIGESANKVYFYKEVPKGTHKLSTESEFSNNDIELKTDGGKNYFVEQFIKMGAFVGGAALKVVSEEEGKKGVLSTNLAK